MRYVTWYNEAHDYRMLTLTLIIISLCNVTVYAATGASCHDNRHINGCSIPWYVPSFYKDTFTPVCNNHDLCYYCASHYNRTRSSCDNEFKRNLMKTCDGWFSWFCRTAAYGYYWSVKYFASSHFVESSPAWCQKTWVKNCTELYK